MRTLETHSPGVRNSDGNILRITDMQYETREEAFDYLDVYTKITPLTKGQCAVILTSIFYIPNEEPQPTLVGK